MKFDNIEIEQGLPPLLFHVGSEEILFDDTVRAEQRAAEAGVSTRLKVWDGMPHVFQAFHFLPEAGQAIREMAEFAETIWSARPLEAPQTVSRPAISVKAD